MLPESTQEKMDSRPNEAKSLGSLISWLSEVVQKRLSAGDVAELRRLAPGELSSAAFWRVCAQVLEPAGTLPASEPQRSIVESRWSVILQALALLGHLHRSGASLGSSLAEAGYSELRFTRLLRARADLLPREVSGAVRFLASKGAAVDAAGIAGLVLSEDRSDEEDTRRQIARDYYRIEART
jgi:CRISPR system Cascade subunit CasB